MKTAFLARTMVAAIAVTMLAVAPSAYAQPFEAGAHVVTANSSQFDKTDVGFGGRFAWRPTGLLGIEAELNTFPSNFPDENGFSSGRLEGLFGATIGPRVGRARPFGRVRPGFLKFSEASGPIACIAIFPPPLACELSAGKTLFALDLGGGLEITAGGSAFVRFDIGDRLVRYPGTVLDTSGAVRDAQFFSHDFRFSAGGGVRF